MSSTSAPKAVPNKIRGRAANEAPTAADRAYDFIRTRLFDGTYEGGMMLSEGDISQALGMSRTPIHEALLRCEFEGHVRLYAKRGALVLPVSAKEISDVLETRSLIEFFAVERACQTPWMGTELLAMVDVHAQLLGQGLDEEFAKADRDFHDTIVFATGNAILVQAYGMARDVPLRVGSVNLRQDPGRVEHVINEHRAIAQGIADGDPAAARDAIEKHLAEAKKSLLRA